MIRKQKNYKRPMKAFEATRIKEENALKTKYALKNKKEVWRTKAKVDYFRGRAKALAQKPLEEQEVLLNKLKALGLNTNTLTEVLDLHVEDLLERRLPTVVVKRKIATTTKQARQMVVHKKILIGGKVVSSPSYLVPLAEEDKISLKKKEKKVKPETKAQEAAPQAEATPESDTPTAKETPAAEPKAKAASPKEEPSKETESQDDTKKQSSDNNGGAAEKPAEESKEENKEESK